MKLIAACTEILSQLSELVREIEQSDFVRPSAALSGSTIGQHLRHTLEFFLCLENGITSGVLNYDERAHDLLIQTDKNVARENLERVKGFVASIDLDATMTLNVNYDINQIENVSITTTAARELVYNVEHAVHHMALIKIGIREVAPYITLVKTFGVAASTVRYQQQSIAAT